MNVLHNIKIFFVSLVMISGLIALGSNPLKIVDFIGSRISLASESEIGGSASVQSNPYNSLALDLKKKELNLEDREYLLDKREQEAGSAGQQKTVMMLSFAVAALFMLIMTNYYLDYHRRRNQNEKTN